MKPITINTEWGDITVSPLTQAQHTNFSASAFELKIDENVPMMKRGTARLFFFMMFYTTDASGLPDDVKTAFNKRHSIMGIDDFIDASDSTFAYQGQYPELFEQWTDTVMAVYSGKPTDEDNEKKDSE